MKRIALPAAALVITALVIADALAEPCTRTPCPSAEPSTAEVTASGSLAASTRANALRIDGGFASAVGLGGLVYTRDLTRWVQLEAGVGVGFSGLQLSVMPKVTVGSGSVRFIAGAGLSVGSHGGLNARDPQDKGAVLFANVDAAGLEVRARNGFTFTLAAGITMPIAGYTGACFDGCNSNGRTYDYRFSPFPQGRIGFGYAF